MNLQTTELLLLADGETAPEETKIPPRKPKWHDTFNYIANPDRFCSENFKKYGPIFKTGVFGGTTVFIGSANANKMAFNGDNKYTEIALPATTMEMFGEYSLFQRPDLHSQRKSALAPGLTGATLAGYIPHINNIIYQGIKTWGSQKIQLYPAVEKISFDILTPLLLGISLNDSDSTTFEGLPISSKAELKALYKTYFDGFYGLLKWQSPLTAYGRGITARKKLIEFMDAVIKRRLGEEENINPTQDFLSMMLVGQQENPDGIFIDILIKNQCLLQLWASHYEISGFVCSLIYQLGKYPQILQKLRQEQEQILGENNNISEFSPEHLKQMTFLEATIKETLRTLPPSSTASRRLTKSVVVDGMLYEKGWTLMAEPRIAHIMPEHFQEPEKFEPERFLPERNEGQIYKFIPFGGGVHGCLGAQMAMIISKIFASHLLRMFEWKIIGEPKFVQFPIKRIADNYQIEINSRV
ncbi:cytochrome P450 [Okeania sp.]|uniref:cytochrome P450 n=1 Tax=Okeania sp. TaxID=3100323 RepID=UPI002B4B102B|nr:cytochrome P450 [Okeania sp.]MEB3342903.1 cytochrome P450 [Okeania sp.]